MKFFYWGLSSFFLGVVFYIQIFNENIPNFFFPFLSIGVLIGLGISIIFYSYYSYSDSKKSQKAFLNSNKIMINKSVNKFKLLLFTGFSLLFLVPYFYFPRREEVLFFSPIWDVFFVLIFIVYGLGLMFKVLIPKE